MFSHITNNGYRFIKKYITKTKAIVPIHLNGMAVDIKKKK